MVKSGEVYSTEEFILDRDGFLTGQDSRPRAVMNSSSKSSGMMAAIQSPFWKPIKEILPGFI